MQLSAILLRFIIRQSSTCAAEMAKPGFYAVRIGRRVGVYRTWGECKSQVKGHPGARYKKFGTQKEAEDFITQGSSSHSEVGTRKTTSFKSKPVSFPQQGKRKTELLTSWKETSSTPIVYTDGCCLSNGKSGAIGGIGVYWGPNHPRNISEYLDTDRPTNQKAELEATIRAIKSAEEMGLESLEIRTDSSYVIKSMTEWIAKWEKNGWKTTKNTDVLNAEQMKQLHSLCQRVNIIWTHVPGHRGVHGNEMADQLANEGALGRGR